MEVLHEFTGPLTIYNFFIIFIEIKFTYHKVYPLNVCNSSDFYCSHEVSPLSLLQSYMKTPSSCQRFEMAQLSLNIQVFQSPVLFCWPACPVVPTCGTRLLTSAVPARGGRGRGLGGEHTVTTPLQHLLSQNFGIY